MLPSLGLLRQAQWRSLSCAFAACHKLEVDSLDPCRGSTSHHIPWRQQRFLYAGQPTPETHPEIMAPGELTPGMQAAEFKERRNKLCALLPPNSLVIVPANSINYMAGVIPYPYRQDADFMYLTGINQRAVAMLQPGSSGVRYTLFLDPPNHERDKWDGRGMDADAADEIFGATDVRPAHELPRALSTAAAKAPAIFFDTDRLSSHHYASISGALRSLVEGDGRRLQPLRPLTHLARLRKSPAEVQLLRRAASLTARGLRRCMAISAPGISEHQLAATFDFECRVRGASRMAFPPVIAGGADGITIHYSRNDKHLPGSVLVKADVGCELHNYVSDVTRTWPIGGRFSPAQLDVYDVVRHVRSSCLAACRPGSSLRQLHELSVRLISEGLRDLGLLGRVDCDVQDRYQDFYWHSVGHWIGLDTHDTSLMGHDRTLQPGHVITIEPGLYVPDDHVYGALRGIGIRIEDDVLVTPEGCEVMSCLAPVEPREVEALVGSAVDAGLGWCREQEGEVPSMQTASADSV